MNSRRVSRGISISHEIVNNARFLFLSLVVIWCAGAVAHGQAVGASLTGQVTDSGGAAIPRATVVAKNVGTNLTLTVTSDGQGTYTISPLPPGTYSLSVEAKGFQSYVQQGIVISVDTASTQDIKLQTGSVQQTVTVTANAELLNTTSGSLGETIDSYEITELPLNGRQPSTLVYLAPGMTAGGNTYNQSGFSFPDESGASANGGDQGSTYYLLDGVPNMDTYLGTAAPFPNADATAEFRVISNNFDAAYGFAPGAIVSIETKSGTNAIHGGVWDFYRDQALNAKDWFTHEINPLHQNQYGGDVGGPILKNKLFYFLNYQGTRNASASSEDGAYVPTPAMLNGDFSAYSTNGQETMCTSGASVMCPFGMVNGEPNQLLPGYQLNPVALQVTKIALPPWHTDAYPDGWVYFKSQLFINNYDEGTARLDYDISPNQRIFLRSFIENFAQPSDAVPGNILAVNDDYDYDYNITERYYNETLGHTWTINPSMVNVLSLFWTQMDASNGSQVFTTTGQPFCWHDYINVSELPGSCYVEGFWVGDDGFDTGNLEPSTEGRTTLGFYDNLTYTSGKHTFSFGADVQHQYALEQTQYPTEPEIGFSGQYTGVGLADYLVGDLDYIYQGAGEVSDIAGWQPGFYGQDQYRIRPNLTLTAGLRLDPNLPPRIADGRGATFIPGEQSVVYPNAPTGLVFPGDHGVGAGLMLGGWGYWEPRIGIAWQPRSLPHTAFHAGFGLFTSPMIYSEYNHIADNAPFAPIYYPQGTSTTPLSFQNPWSGFAGTGGVSPFPPFASASYKPPSTATFTSGLTIPATIDPHFKLGTTQSWNMAAQQQIGKNMVFGIAYVGSETYHAPIILDRNPGIYATGGALSTYPFFSEIQDMMSYGTANDNALQVSLNRHLDHNLQFQTNFTWSKTIDDASSANISLGDDELGDPFDIGWSRGISAEDVPFRWVSEFVYTVPQPPLSNRFLRQAMGGWEVSAIITDQSGSPFTVAAGFGGNQSEAQLDEDRADAVPGQSLNVRKGGRSHWLNDYFNINAFKQNAPGTFGNSGKGIMLGPPLNYADAGVYRNFRFHDRYNAQFRWEMYNAFNHPSFAAPNATNQISMAGVNSGGGEGQITGTGGEGARIGQLALKFTF
jgi:hypothetical protein